MNMNSQDNNTVNYFEEYVKGVLKIPYCNFEGLDPKIAYEIVVGLSLMYEMYPFFNRVICAINQIEDYEAHINMLDYIYNDNPIYHEAKEDKNGVYGFHTHIKEFSDSSPIIDRSYNPYFSLLIYDNVKNVDISNIQNLFISSYGRVGIYHEFGHLLDVFLNISNNEKFKTLISNRDIKKEVSEYACTNNHELVACAFSRYILSKGNLTALEKNLGKFEFSNIEYTPSDLIIEIGKFIDEEYKKFAKFKQIKFINRKYNFNKKFSINRRYKHVDVKQLEDNIKRTKI